jgi:hypothetical protein
MVLAEGRVVLHEPRHALRALWRRVLDDDAGWARPSSSFGRSGSSPTAAERGWADRGQHRFASAMPPFA